MAEGLHEFFHRREGAGCCERAGASQFLRHNPSFKRFAIDRAHVEADKYADQVGHRFVSTIYHGKALFEAGADAKTVRFICLHAGIGRRPVFVYTLAD